MATILRTVHWTVLADIPTALEHIGAAVKTTDFSVVSSSAELIVIDVPRALRKNRWAATITGEVSPSPKGTAVRWTVDGLGDKHFEHMVTIANGLPEGSLYDHGIPEAVSKVSLTWFGRKEIRHLANVLDSSEQVLAIGVGQLAGKGMGIVALTDRRLLFMEKSMLSESVVEFALSSIGALSLGKKMGGETLTVSHSGTSAIISTMPHGQGEALVRVFRELKEQPAAEAAAPAPDAIDQIARLGELRDKGLLTDEEFQSQKAILLAKL